MASTRSVVYLAFWAGEDGWQQDTQTEGPGVHRSLTVSTRRPTLRHASPCVAMRRLKPSRHFLEHAEKAEELRLLVQGLTNKRPASELQRARTTCGECRTFVEWQG